MGFALINELLHFVIRNSLSWSAVGSVHMKKVKNVQIHTEIYRKPQTQKTLNETIYEDIVPSIRLQGPVLYRNS